MKSWIQFHTAICLIFLLSVMIVQSEYKFVTFRVPAASDWHAPLSKEKLQKSCLQSPSFQSWCLGYSWCCGGALGQKSSPKSTLHTPSFFSWLSGGSNRRQLGALGGLLQPSTLISLGTVKPIEKCESFQRSVLKLQKLIYSRLLETLLIHPNRQPDLILKWIQTRNHLAVLIQNFRQ